MIPQLTIIILGMISLGINIAKHGEPKKTNHNAWFQLICTLIYWAILYYGGFWHGLI